MHIFCNLTVELHSITFATMDKKETGIVEVFTDDEIIARILTGDKELYTLLIKKYNARMYRVAIAILNDDTEAEDAMQTAYINAYEHLRQFAFRCRFSTWLIRILVNECLLRVKLKKRITAMEEPNLDHRASHSNVRLITPSEKMINNELRDILERSIRRLPEKYRVVFVMREIEGLTIAETQDCLGLSTANVKVRLNRAKVLLKETLSGYYKKEDILHFHLIRCDRMAKTVMSKIDDVKFLDQIV